MKWSKMSRIQAAFKENDSTLDTAPCPLDTAPCAEKILTHFVRILTKSAENILGENGGVDLDTAPCLEAVLWSLSIFKELIRIGRFFTGWNNPKVPKIP